MHMSYWRFAAMIATSTVVMFALMYLNTYAWEHVFWSETRTWMALLMGASMAIIMLGYMLGMYSNRMVNVAIFIGSALVFALALWLVRSQATVSDRDYMKAMIPHHSIAVLTSERAQISDPRVRKLADEIIEAQRREIAEMRYLVRSIAREGEVPALHEATTQPRVVTAREAIAQPAIASIDLGELELAEIERVLGPGRRCSFSYSRAGPPVLAAEPPGSQGPVGRGVVKLHGRLVELAARYTAEDAPLAGGLTLAGDGIRVLVDAPADAEPGSDDAVREADAHLQLDAGLQVGYGGFFACRAAAAPPGG